MVRHATDTAVSASISTPVGPVTLTVARTMQPGSFLSGVMSRVTFDSASGWHSGIRSEVPLAPTMRAMRAAPSTSPFLALPEAISSSVALAMTTRPSATAVRSVAALAETSTIRASPDASIWVRAAAPLEALSLEALSAIGLASPGGARPIGTRQQCAGCRGHISLPHQALADQEGRHADAFEPGEVRRR